MHFPNSPTKTDSDALLNERQAAAFLGCTGRFLQQRRRVGDGPLFVRISSRCVRYRPTDLEAWIEQRIRKSTSDSGPEDAV